MTNRDQRVDAFAAELRKWWSFDDGQIHTHSWHSREDFIERKLPELLSDGEEKSADATDSEIKVTPEMVEAGVRVLRASGLLDDAREPTWAIEPVVQDLLRKWLEMVRVQIRGGVNGEKSDRAIT